MTHSPLEADLNHVLEMTKGLWEELRGKRIFITGGTGFFGCWLLESFLWANDRLGLNAKAVVLTRNPVAFEKKVPHLAKHRDVRLYRGNVRSFSYPRGTFSHVIHAAGDSNLALNRTARAATLKAMTQGTERVLKFAEHSEAKKVLFVSSGAVYGRNSKTDIYGEGKRRCELLCEVYCTQNPMEVKIARCFAFVGPYQNLNAHYAVGNFIRDALKGGPIRINGNGRPIRSYLYASDLMVWLWKILFVGRSCHPYNVGSEHSVTIADLAQKVSAIIGKQVKVQIAQKADAKKRADCYVPSTKRARSELGLKETVSLASAIKKTIVWHQGKKVRPSK